MMSRRRLHWAGGLTAALACVLIGWLLSTTAPTLTDLAQEPDQFASRGLRVATERETDAETAAAGEWRLVQLERCGGMAIGFYLRQGRAGEYLWAIGQPANPDDRSIVTGTATALGEPAVAARRARLPVCELVLGTSELSADTIDVDAVAPHQVVSVSTRTWQRGGEFTLDRETGVDGTVSIRSFIFGRIADPRIRAVELLTPDGRLRYTVESPFFLIHADLVGAGRFELLDERGMIVAAGRVVERLDIVRPAAGDAEPKP